MKKIFKEVLECAKNGKVDNNIEQLKSHLAKITGLTFPKESVAIWNIIRLSYNYYMDRGEVKNAEIIVEIFRPKTYIWKVINRYRE